MNNPLGVSKTCSECDGVFFKKSSESKVYWTEKKFCSADCSNKNRIGAHFSPNSQFKKGRVISEEERKKLLGHEPWNKGISVHLSSKSEFKKGNKINLGRKRLDVGEKSGCWKPKIERPCAYCQKILKLSLFQIKNRDKNFCNRECWALGTRGLGSPVYKGEQAVSRLRGRIACMPEYKEWHAAVMKRDGYRCTQCNCVQSKDNPLEVDHIKRFLFIANENRIITPEDARNCKELWDVKNGRILCRACHRISDTYGTKGTKRK